MRLIWHLNRHANGDAQPRTEALPRADVMSLFGAESPHLTCTDGAAFQSQFDIILAPRAGADVINLLC